MALVLKDRVKETSSSSGLGSITLGGAFPGYQTFNAAIASGSTVYYTIHNLTVGFDTEWEVGVGTFTSPATLSRDTILSSSTGSKVNFTAGTEGLEVFVTQPAEEAIYINQATGLVEAFGNGTNSISFTTITTNNAVLSNGTINATPSNGTDITNKTYVDTIASSGLHYHQAVNYERPNTDGNLAGTYADGGTTPTWTDITNNKQVATGSAHGLNPGDVIVFGSTTNGITAGTGYFVKSTPTSTSITLTLTYDGAEITSLTNGTGLSITSRANSGVGATLTNSGANVALVIDGITVSNGNRILIYSQTNAYENGVYTVTNAGAPDSPGPGSAWVLTRAADADTYAPNSDNTLGQGDVFYVTGGNTGAGESYVMATSGTIIFGTTNLTFNQISSAQVYSAGTGLNLANLTFSIANTAVTAATYGNDGNVAQITVNAQGQLTNAANVAINASSISVGTLSNDRTTANSANGASTIVLRDTNGSFAGNVITATDVNSTNVTATTGSFTNISGNAATVTAINASNISSGTIANARTTGNTANSASTLVLRDANGNFGSNVITASLFSGDGSGINAINASNISSGTIANARTTAASANGASTIVLRDSGGNFSANTITANISGDISGGTNINASNITSGTISNARTTASSANGASTIVLRDANGSFDANVVNATNLSGGGTSITSMNASNLSAGTVASARVSGSYTGITGVGTVTAGTWNANTIATNYGGTGLTSFTANGVVYASSTSALATGSGFVFDGTNVGIGTSSPAAQSGFTTNRVVLQINNSGYGQLRLGDGAGFMLDQDTSGTTTTTIRNLYGATSGSALMQIQSGYLTFGTGTSYSERMRIDSAGNVGIGTSSPAERLDVQGTGDIKARIYTTGATLGTHAGLYLKTGSYEYIIQNFTTTAGSAGALRFYDITANAERMRIDSSGNVLVGTTTAQELLTVNKNAAFGTTADAFSEIRFFNSTATSGTTRIRADAGDLAFFTSNAERFRFGSAGQFGIGGATYGSSGQVLTSGGASAAPSWTSVANSVNAGTGISVNQTTGSVTVTNTGVTAVNAGTGISVNQTTGSLTVTNSGVTSLTAGTGISVSASTGGITITNTSSVNASQLARAWVSFNNSGTILASFNVSSIGVRGTGLWNVNFTSALTDGNYAMATAAGIGPTAFNSGGCFVGFQYGPSQNYGAPTSTQAFIFTTRGTFTGGDGTLFNPFISSCVFFR